MSESAIKVNVGHVDAGNEIRIVVYDGSDNVEVSVNGDVTTVPKELIVRTALQVADTQEERWFLGYGKAFEDAVIFISETPMSTESKVQSYDNVVDPALAIYDDLIQKARRIVASEREIDDENAKRNHSALETEEYLAKRRNRLERLGKLKGLRAPDFVVRNERLLLALQRVRYYSPDRTDEIERIEKMFETYPAKGA